MRGRGVPDVRFPQDAVEAARKTFGLRAVGASPSEDEVELATVDVGCRRESLIDDVYRTQLVSAARTWFEERSDDLLRVHQVREQGRANAQKILQGEL